jgi:hypothetical protein
MAPAKSARGPLHGGSGGSADMLRSSTNTSTSSGGYNAGHGHGHGHAHAGQGYSNHAHPHAMTCGCGNLIHPGNGGSKPSSAFHDLGLSSSTKTLSSTAALKRQRELREFALVSKRLFTALIVATTVTSRTRPDECSFRRQD